MDEGEASVAQPRDRAFTPCLFVGGGQRSGTTLIQRLLCQTRETNPLVGEAKYLRNLLAAYRHARRAFDLETRFYFRSVGELRQFHAGTVERLLAHVHSVYPGARQLVLKEPHLTLYFAELAELLPHASFLVIVRDPRDAVASMIQVGERLVANGADDVFARMFSARDMPALGSHYLSFYQAVLSAPEAVPARRLKVVRYEDLVADTPRLLTEVGRFAGLDLSGVDTDGGEDSDALQARRQSPYQRAWLTHLDERPVSGERVGAYRKVLSDAEARRLVIVCRDFMARFGYSTDG